MSTDTATQMLLETSIPATIPPSSLASGNETQTSELSPGPQTPPVQPVVSAGVSTDAEMADADVSMPDEAALAAAAAAMAAAAQGQYQDLSQQQPSTEEAVNGTDDLNSYLLAAAAASVHAQQQLNGDDPNKAQSEDSFDSTATPNLNSVYTNGTSVNGSDEDDARAAIHDRCRKYTDDRAPYPLSIGKRMPGGCAELLADRPYDPAVGATELEHLPLSEAHVELGKTRCYWALLSADHSRGNGATGEKLEFVYLDPVLQQHMGAQADGMVGSDFYDYVHPEERDRVSDDMQKIVESRTLFGSVTRCRYSRIPRIRELLGAVNPPRDPEADRYVEDDSFVAIDIVINWIGDGMLLCFFHAIIDKGPEDNDEQHKSDWTNWCGTPPASFTLRQCDSIWKHVKAVQRETVPESGPVHVFQVIEAGGNGRVLLSWPPPRLFSREADAQLVSQSDTTIFQDGSYFADDFARLAQGVSIAPGSSSLSDANTSCTRRFRAKHTLTTEGKIRSIESVLIPYGGVILACFHTTFQQQLPPPDPKLVLQARATIQAQAQAERRKAEDDQAQSSPSKRLRLEIDAEQGDAKVDALSQATAAEAKPQVVASTAASKPSAAAQALSQLASSTHKASTNGVLSPAAQNGVKTANGQTPKPSAATKYTKIPVKSDISALLYTNAPTKPSPAPTPASRPATSTPSTPSAPATSAPTNGHGTGDSPSNPNKACTGCGKINSPEWRRGPSGHKTLCNACGLRYARSLTRRKKKKGKDGQVEFIEPTGDPSVVPKSRGGGGGSLPGVHRKNSKKRKEEEAAKAAAAAAAAGGQPVSTQSPSSSSAASTPAKSTPPVNADSKSTPTKDITPATPVVAEVKVEQSEPKPDAALPPASSEPVPMDPAHSLAVSIALDAVAKSTAAVDTESISLPVSNAISRAIAATIGSTNPEAASSATSAAGNLLTSQSLGPTTSADAADGADGAGLDPAVSAAALKTIESVVSKALFEQLVGSNVNDDKPDAITAVNANGAAEEGGLDLSHALTADAIRAAAQAAVAHGVAAEDQPPSQAEA